MSGGLRCHARKTGFGRTALLLAGVGLAALAAAPAADAASAKGRGDGNGDGAAQSRPAGTPVMAIVALRQQRVTVYDLEGPILQAPVSTGQTGYETPAGIFTVLEKQAEHYSNLYDDAAMPFMQRLTWSGIALHAGALPGYPASHGCIRMPFAFAERLFARTRPGMRVIIARDDVTPAEFAHPALFRPAPAEAMGTGTGAPARLADASGQSLPAGARPNLRAVAVEKSAAAARAAEKAQEIRSAARQATIEAARATKLLRRTEGIRARAEVKLRQVAGQLPAGSDAAAVVPAGQPRTAAQSALAAAQAQLDLVRAEVQPKIDLAAELRDQVKQAEAASAAAAEEAREAARRLQPVSVFISRATQRLYVRQAREPLFESPVGIAHADRPLGTYVFTALAYKDADTDLRWNAVSMYRSPTGGSRSESAAGRGDRHAGAAAADLTGAKLALDRIRIPKDAADRISEVISPGSALIVSDESLHRETGKATEFIVLMSNEPQGGIRIRPRPTFAPDVRNGYPPEVRNGYQPEVRGRYRPQQPYAGSPFGNGPPFWWW
jgi:hypothetical protein